MIAASISFLVARREPLDSLTDGMRDAFASNFLVALLEHPDHRVRRNAESALQNMGGTTTNVAHLKQAKAPERHFRLPLPGVALSELDLPARSQARLDAMLPGVREGVRGDYCCGTSQDKTSQ